MSTRKTKSKILSSMSRHWLNSDVPLLFDKICHDDLLWDLTSMIPKDWKAIRDDYRGRVKVFNQNSDKHRTTLDANSAIPFWVDGATLYLIDYFETSGSGIKKWISQLREAYGYEGVIVSVFVSFPGATMPYHWDAVANLTCQISGSKRWWTHGNSIIKYPDFNFAPGIDVIDSRFSDVTVPDISNDEVEFVLNEYAGVFLSRGLLHRTITETTSVSMSVTFKPKFLYAELVNELARELSKHEEFRIDTDAVRNLPKSSDAQSRRRILLELAHKVRV